jgi:predicted RNase H-like HicB family nuclease
MFSLQLLYTDPADGDPATAQANVSLQQLNDPDAGIGGQESAFLSATTAGSDADGNTFEAVRENIDELIADLIEGKPSTYSDRQDIVQAMISEKEVAAASSITVYGSATTIGFVADVPCCIISDFGTVVDWVIPSAVDATLTIPTTGAGALGANIYKGYLIQQCPAAGFVSSLARSGIFGIRSQLQRPAVPTVVLADGGTSIDVTITAPTSNGETIVSYDIFVSDADDFSDGTIPVGVAPDVEDTTTVGSAVNVTTYKGGATEGNGGDISAATWYVAVIAKTATGRYDFDQSAVVQSSVVVA